MNDQSSDLMANIAASRVITMLGQLGAQMYEHDHQRARITIARILDLAGEYCDYDHPNWATAACDTALEIFDELGNPSH